jgi:hypothetical protein
MRILEAIHLRMAGDDPKNLAEIVRTAVGNAAESHDLRIYHHARLEGDLLVHLYREATEQRNQASELGLALASLLRVHGLVEHSIWVQSRKVQETV